MTVRYLTFDCYGTLVDWKSGIEGALASSLGKARSTDGLMRLYLEAERKEEAHYKRYRQVLQGSFASVSAALGLGDDRSGGEAFAETLPHWPPFPDSSSFLKRAGELGYGRYILSNVDNDLLEETVRNNHLEIDGSVTAEDVGSYKPDPRHWLEFLKGVGAERGEVLHIAQSIYHDVVPALELGIDTLWVNRYAEPLPVGVSPTVISSDLRSFADELPALQ